MKSLHYLILVASFVFISSCNKSNNLNSETKDLTLTLPEAKDKAPDLELLSTDTSTAISLQGNFQGQNPDWNKKIIKTAFLKLEVKDFKVYGDILPKVVKQYGGYIANEEQNQSSEKKESTISIKVPVEQFESLMNHLPNDAEKIIQKKIATEDVTGEVVDSKSRLHAKEKMRLKYLEFLKQAKNMEDVLKVQSEINDIQEELESASGRINYLAHQSAYSTINLTFYQPLAGYNPSNDNPGFITRTLEAFKNGFNFIGELFIGIISVWPLFTVIFIGWFFLKRRSLTLMATKQK